MTGRRDHAEQNQTHLSVERIRELAATAHELYLWTIMVVETYRYGTLQRIAQREFCRRHVLRLLKRIEQGQTEAPVPDRAAPEAPALLDDLHERKANDLVCV